MRGSELHARLDEIPVQLGLGKVEDVLCGPGAFRAGQRQATADEAALALLGLDPVFLPERRERLSPDRWYSEGTGHYVALMVESASLSDLPESPEEDPELTAIADELVSHDADGLRVARVLRRTYDVLLDGQHTGRYCWDQLYKTEKTHFGTLVEINLQREFDFADGRAMDFAIRGIHVDCKYSQGLADWMIPPEALGHIILGP